MAERLDIPADEVGCLVAIFKQCRGHAAKGVGRIPILPIQMLSLPIHIRLPPHQVAEKCADLYLNYGTTLAGLVASGHTIDYDDWHAFVSDSEMSGCHSTPPIVGGRATSRGQEGGCCGGAGGARLGCRQTTSDINE